MTAESKGRDLFIVDNSVSGWTGLRYLEEWSGIAKAFDIATGYFEIGALLALDGKWQPLKATGEVSCTSPSFGDLVPRSTHTRVSHSAANTEWKEVIPDEENCAFVPQDRAGRRAIVRLDDVFVKFGAGIKTNRDAVAIAFSKAELLRAVEAYSPSLASCAHVDGCVQTILYRPFDERVIFYHETVVASRSLPTMQHVLVGANLGLIASSTWTTPERFSVNVSRSMVEMKTGTHDRGTTYFPLYRYEKILGAPATRVDNLKPEFLERWGRITQMPLTADGNESQSRTSGPEDVLHWLYAICHSCEYRLRHRALLAQGFPIVLFPRQPELLQDIARLGGELVAVHLMDSPQLDRPITTYTGPKNPEVGRVGWSDDTVWLDAAATRRGQSATPGTMGFRGVPEAVWNFHIGGYQVCEKWLKDRKGRTLTNDDLAHYRKIVVALAETIRLMQEEIDEVIERYGGWPGASRRATPRP